MAQSNNDIIEEDLSTNGLTGSDLDFEIIQENEFQECITTNGITGISSLIKSKLEKYKTVKLNMGFRRSIYRQSLVKTLYHFK